MSDIKNSPPPISWLLLVHQLPPNPPYFRVKVWRRLQAIGAVPVKASVYALPHASSAMEDFQHLLQEIIAGGGEAMLCQAQLIDGLTNLDVKGLFNAARSRDYETLAADVSAVAETLPAEPLNHWNGAPDVQVQLIRLRKRLAQIAAIDFFHADGQRTVEHLLASLQAQVAPQPDADPKTPAPPPASLVGHTWVTRRGVGVDRIACAWLIRRFIDPAARFRFVGSQAHAPEAGELRFDMLDAEFTHEGDRCSFETFLNRVHLTEPALKAIGEIIHDIDLQDAKFGREEASGIARLIDGIALAHADDEHRIARGSAILDDLYTAFSR